MKRIFIPEIINFNERLIHDVSARLTDEWIERYPSDSTCRKPEAYDTFLWNFHWGTARTLAAIMNGLIENVNLREPYDPSQIEIDFTDIFDSIDFDYGQLDEDLVTEIYAALDGLMGALLNGDMTKQILAAMTPVHDTLSTILASHGLKGLWYSYDTEERIGAGTTALYGIEDADYTILTRRPWTNYSDVKDLHGYKDYGKIFYLTDKRFITDESPANINPGEIFALCKIKEHIYEEFFK